MYIGLIVITIITFLIMTIVLVKTPGKKNWVCNQCGSPLPYQVRFCPRCGERVYKPSKKEKKEKSKEIYEALTNMVDKDPVMSKTKNMSFENAMGYMLERRNILTDNQRMDDDDYGFSMENPIVTGTNDGSIKYLSLLRTENGDPIKWEDKGFYHLDQINGVESVSVHEYSIWGGGISKTIYICPHGHSINSAPKGFYLEKEAQ